ncbi:MAG: lipase maturation factor family protein [Gammaproteobacteria bacterium]|jgi:predicted DCC family thiol-disulfide oxidoreductase YuxK
MNHTDARAPLLAYDGDCGFCAYWVRYWQRLTGDRVHYAPYQEIIAEHPEVTEAEFARAIQLFDPDGGRSSGAGAAFRVLALARRGAGLWLYRHLPGFAWIAEAVYALVARHREAAYHVSRLLWGAERYPPTWHLVSWLFLRLLGLTFLVAFMSIGSQVIGLIGSDGVLPVTEKLATLAAEHGPWRFWVSPTLFWIDSSDPALVTACVAGATAAVLIVLNVLTRPMLVLAFILQLSLWVVMPVFGNIQPDALLLEVGLLAVFLTGGSRIVVWLYRWLLFRFMLLSGLVKLLTHDTSWAQLTALNYHYETQPLPTPLAWYAHQLPAWFQQFSVLSMFGIELLLPWLIFMPRRLRFVAAGGFLVLQVLIILTGNYYFLNLLTIFLCLFLLDDRALASLLPGRLAAHPRFRLPEPGRLATAAAGVLASLVVAVNLAVIWKRIEQRPLPEPLATLAATTSRLGITNFYGFFGVMNTTRREIIVEGSLDGRDWRAYAFRYKPGDVHRCPRWSLPHHPRLDWTLWFAAGESPYRNRWFGNLLYQLLEGSPPVLGLLADNPFPDEPPKWVRATLYQYRFTTAAERAATGDCWVRQRLGPYVPPLSLESWAPG